MKKAISKFILNLFGWKVVNNIPPDMKKSVMIAAPHTSNWDFVGAIPALAVLGIKSRYLIKDDYFKSPLAFFFRWTGGIPVDRSKRNNLSDQLKEMLLNEETMHIVFPAEGTRKRVARWKTGFYYVAIETGLPFTFGVMDYKRRILGVEHYYVPTGNFEEDMIYIENYFKTIGACHPESYNTSIFERNTHEGQKG